MSLQVSFEFFPPRTPEMEETLWRAIKRLEPMAPRFVSVTYGAGGSTRERTHRTVKRILAETALLPAAHLTCVGATRAEVDEVARDYWTAGIRHIVALRGDPPRDAALQPPHPGGYPYASDLVGGLRAIADFDVTVAAFPEGHPESTSVYADLDNLKRKLDAGATRAITQFFFEPECFFHFRDKAAAAGITAEIVPGIMPIMSFASVQRMSGLCGTAIPVWMETLFDGLDERPAARQLVAAAVAAELCRRLYAGDVRKFHFYTLNRAELSYAICHLLGRRPVGDAQ